MLQRLATCADLTSLDSMNRDCKLADGALSTRVNGMKSYIQFGVVICLISFSISAFAGSVETFNYSTTVGGVNDTTVQGTFNYNLSTNTYTLASLSFTGNSIFNGVSGKDLQPQSGNTFVLNETVDGYTVSYTIVLNPLTGAYTANGSISFNGTTGTIGFTRAPEGGAQLAYLAASGLALFAGIVLAGKQRRRPAEN